MSKPIALIVDADLLVYRAAWACNDESETVALRTARNLLYTILADKVTEYDEWEVVISCPSEHNFRHKHAVTAPYKGNRAPKPGEKSNKPVHYDAIRTMWVEEFDAAMSDGMEADDLINIKAHAWHRFNHHPIIASVDKDFVQCGWEMWDFVKRKVVQPTPEDMIKALYLQCLTGDAADNIKGIHGIGPGKAAKLLEDYGTQAECYVACIDAYMDEQDLTDSEATARVDENCHLLYLLSHVEDAWTPPAW